MIDYGEFKQHADALRDRVKIAASQSDRNADEIRILPVTKTFPIDAVEYCKSYGFTAVGENRVQEVLEKQGEHRSAIRWELIGHLQSNKAKVAIESFDVIQSVDSEKLLEKLQRQATGQNRRLPILLQFNTGEDPQKFGFNSEQADSAVELALKCDHLKLDGLMTIAPLDSNPDVARRAFSRLRELRDRLSRDFGISLPELSMGMSGDLECAIQEGSSCIRVGSALFGARSSQLNL